MARPEQTEKATPKHRDDARQKGRVARSHDLAGAAIFLVLVITLHLGLMRTIDDAGNGFRVAFSQLHGGELTVWTVPGLFVRDLWSYLALLGLMFGAAIAVALAANWLQFGFLFTTTPLQPNFSKLNPIPAFGRIFFSKQTVVNLVKQLLKLGAVALIIGASLKDRLGDLYSVAHLPPHQIVAFMDDTLYGVGIRFGFLLLVLGLVDYAWERRSYEDSLKMSKQEIRDESKQAEGNPEAKSAVKSRQRASARRRMMSAVPKATVIITNPTHFAVALSWDDEQMEAPVVVAKGADLIAKRIRDIAAEHDIPIMENPPLARNLYKTCPLDSAVPPSLYAAVAQVIAFVFRLKERTSA